MDYLKVFIFSATPVFEVRGGLPLGIILGLSAWEAYFVSVAGNIAVIIPLQVILARLESFFLRFKIIEKLHTRMVFKATQKKESFRKYGKYALLFFVAIPLPTTGAWTACVAARLFRIPMWDSFLIISLGVLISGLIILSAKVLTLSGISFFW